MVGQPAETGAAVRCRRGPLRRTTQVAAGTRTTAASTQQPGRATDWLRVYLAQRGAVLSTQVIADATAAGISLTTLYKARIELNVRLQRVPGVGARHTWS